MSCVDNNGEGGTSVSHVSPCKTKRKRTHPPVTTGVSIPSVDGTTIFVTMAIIVTEGSESTSFYSLATFTISGTTIATPPA